jgi:FkbM family methyltransferase
MQFEQLKWTYRAWRYRYRLERQELRQLMAHLAAGDTAVDIGAHKGAYTYWMRRAVGPRGRVYAFEPQPDLAERLRELVRGRGIENVEVENAALSSCSGTLLLHVPGGATSPGASLEPRAHDKSYPVRVTTLDEYFETEERSRIRFLKCDAEGHELEVFRGGRTLLAEIRPILLFECELRHRRSGSVAEVFDWLRDLGYRGYFIDHHGPADIEGFSPERHQADHRSPGYVNNFLFLPASGAS